MIPFNLSLLECNYTGCIFGEQYCLTGGDGVCAGVHPHYRDARLGRYLCTSRIDEGLDSGDHRDAAWSSG